MPAFKEYIQGKKVTVLGLGLLGRGVGDVEFLAQCGAHVLATDLKSAEALELSVAKLKHFTNVQFRLGQHVEEDFTHADLVIKAAGVPLDSIFVAAAKKAGVTVTMSTALFAKYAMAEGVKIVGITGTRGKTTVSQMIHDALAGAGKRVHLGGNIRGLSTLALLPKVQAGDVAVLELDSWQLQGFGDLQMSPNVSIFTNLMPDHQNYYPDMDSYFTDKSNIFKYQKEGDTLIVGQSVANLVYGANPPVLPVIPAPLSADLALRIPGEHNRENASLAAQALRALGLTEDEIRVGVTTFAGVEGRLQLVGEKNGIKIYNDNNATTPEATVAALRALGDQSVVLIAGGSDKGLDMGELIKEMKKCKTVILLSGSGTARISSEFPEALVCDSMGAAVEAAFEKAASGDVLLFSPGFASFGMFTNEYDRNDEFLRLVRSHQS